MKKIIFKSASVFMMAVAAICFTACGSDDDSKNNPENGGNSSSSQSGSFSESMLVGMWEGPIHVEGMIRDGSDLIPVSVDYPSKDNGLVEKLYRCEFKSDHTWQEWVEKNNQFVAREDASWTLNGNTLKIIYDDENLSEFKVQSLDANSMVLRQDIVEGISDGSYIILTYRRVQ